MSQRACCSSLRSVASIGHVVAEQRAITRCVSSAASATCSLASPELQLGPRQLVAVRALGRGAQLLEPVAQARCRHAVVAVVALDDRRCARRTCSRPARAIETELELRLRGGRARRGARRPEVLAHLDGPFERAAARRRDAQVLLALRGRRTARGLSASRSRRWRAASAGRSCAGRRTARRAGSCRAPSRASRNAPTGA